MVMISGEDSALDVRDLIPLLSASTPFCIGVNADSVLSEPGDLVASACSTLLHSGSEVGDMVEQVDSKSE